MHPTRNGKSRSVGLRPPLTGSLMLDESLIATQGLCLSRSTAWQELKEQETKDRARSPIGFRPHLMGWTAPHKASRCRRVIVEDESPERAVHDKNYHHRSRPCKEGISSPRRRCRGQGRRRAEAQTQGGVGVLRKTGAVPGGHGGLRECALLGA